MNRTLGILAAVFGGILVLACVIGFIIVGGINTAYAHQKDVEKAAGDISVNIKRKYDLYDDIEAAVEANAAQEIRVFETLRDQAIGLQNTIPTNAQGEAVAPQTPEELAAMDAALANYDQALLAVNVYVADNPEIQSAQLFSDFMVQAEGSENRIAVARIRYNDEVRDLSLYCLQIPGRYFCNMAGVDGEEWQSYELSESDEDPEVDFGLNDE